MATKECIIRRYVPWGGHSGSDWDDGKCNHMRIVAIHLTVDQNLVLRSIQSEYVSSVMVPRHGGATSQTYKVEFKGDKQLTKISGHYGYDANNYHIIKSLKFETDHGKYDPFKKEDGTPFECLPMKKIVGFFGRGSSGYVDAIGIYAIPHEANE